MKPASPPSSAYSIRVFAAGTGKAIFLISTRMSSRSFGPAAIIPPPKRTISGSIVCIRQTAPHGQVIRSLGHQFLGKLVSRVGGLVDGSAREIVFLMELDKRRIGMLIEGFHRPFDQRGRRSIGLEVPLLAARAGAPPSI